MENVLSIAQFELMRRFIEERCGIVLGEEKRYLVECRVSSLMRSTNITVFEDYYHLLQAGRDSHILDRTIDQFTTNETFWFRDKTPWQVFEEQLLPRYIQEIRSAQRQKVRIWSAACSSGQEPYSIAMCIDRYLARHHVTDVTLGHFSILASDISDFILRKAVEGRYDDISMDRGLDPESRATYFARDGGTWIIDQRIRDAVDFRRINLKQIDTRSGSYDVIFCRYVLIYFSDVLRQEILAKIAVLLNTNGIVFLGASEMAADSCKQLTAHSDHSGKYYVKITN